MFNFYKFASYLLVLSLLLMTAAIMAQVPVADTTGVTVGPFPDGNTSLEDLMDWYHALYGALVIIWGYVGRSFKITQQVPNYVFVVLAGGVVIFGGFVALGFTGFFPYLFSFLSAIGIYDIILKPIQKLRDAKKEGETIEEQDGEVQAE